MRHTLVQFILAKMDDIHLNKGIFLHLIRMILSLASSRKFDIFATWVCSIQVWSIATIKLSLFDS